MKRHAVKSKPTPLSKAAIPCNGGPNHGRRMRWGGRTARVQVGILCETVKVFGEYRLTSRPLGERKGHAVYYQWFGPSDEAKPEREPKAKPAKAAPAGPVYVKTRCERRKKATAASSAGVATAKQKHAGALTRRGRRVPMQAANDA